MVVRGEASRRDTDGAPQHRWTLARAGIVNVYQYENETLHFGGGRLLLRGVNGSGKSTAMNMLLPFLITASLRRIDASGEQTGVLKSWMLSGRDDPQPLGYLWIEFAIGSVTLTCGCGVKANRSTDTLRTWWFITDRRPGIDLALVEEDVPLSDDALRAEIGADAVFPHDRRGDYRAEIRRRLFGGADLEQHLQLLNAVRNPRVGDRIDLDLPNHLTNALPELSEGAVSEAARPLDDLDEHRRNVTALAQTDEALDGLTNVYQGYLQRYFEAQVDEGRSRLAALDQLVSQAANHRRAQQRAEEDKVALETEVDRLTAEEQRLGTEISALKNSPAYQEGSKLEELEGRVGDAERACSRTRAQLDRNQVRLDDATSALRAGEAATDTALAELAAQLDSVGRLRAATNVAAVAPASSGIPRSPIAPGCSTPDRPLDTDSLDDALAKVDAAAVVRESERREMLELVDLVDEAIAVLNKAEVRRADRRVVAEAHEADLVAARDELGRATRHWDDEATRWCSQSLRLVGELRSAPATIDLAVDGRVDGTVDGLGSNWSQLTNDRPTFADHADRAIWRDGLRAEIDRLVSIVQRAAARAESVEEAANEVVEQAASELGHLEALSEPDPPLLPWQRRRGPCLADLVDFDSGLDDDARAGLEAALEASGLLMATIGDDGLVLEDGDLVLVGDGTAPSPLSELLSVVVPRGDGPGGSGDVDWQTVPSGETVALALASISTSEGPEWPAFVSTDGGFRLGSAHGRHRKRRAEYIGATARRETLQRRRAEARAALADAEAELAKRATARAWYVELQHQAEERAQALPSLNEIALARHGAEQSEHQLATSRELLAEADEDVAAAEADHIERLEHTERTAHTLQLPFDRRGLEAVQRDLGHLRAACSAAKALAKNVEARCEQWEGASRDWQAGDEDRLWLEAEHQRLRDEHVDLATKLATLQDSVGLPYQEVVEAIAVSEGDLRVVRRDLPARNEERERALVASAEAGQKARSVDDRIQEHEDDARTALDRVDRALDLSGVVDGFTGSALDRSDRSDRDDQPAGGRADPAVVDAGSALALVEPVERSPSGYRRRIGQLASQLTSSARNGEKASADGLRLSLRRRRDALGSGWDAEARQPDDRLPIVVEVEGPLGQMALPAAGRAAAEQLERMSALLTAKQHDALRDLLQGLVANEVAEKMDTASGLVHRMNEHLRKVTTAHGLGVELRWRRRPELAGIDGRMIDLLGKLPDLRTEDETRELRDLVSAQLSEARALEPEASYRELIARSLDYRRWHEMTVLTRWGDGAPQKLGRNHRFSEGEKKLVTYIPFLAAVAVSCDAIAEHDPVAPRFVLLDDAMAKVSEDNHADLLGLLVDLDLDVIATSERLWGTHATVPELAITEVVRDAELGVILLDHFHWDGSALSNRVDPTGDEAMRRWSDDNDQPDETASDDDGGTG